MRLAAFWLSLTALLPLLLAQAVYARRRTPELPEAVGARRSRQRTTANCRTRLIAVGESPLAGVGIAQLRDTLAPRLAHHLVHELALDGLDWDVLAASGRRLHQLPRLEFDPVPPAHRSAASLLLLVIGVNDVTSLTPGPAWSRGLRSYLKQVPEHIPVYVSGLPPMGRFSALPRPLCWVLDMRCRILDARTRSIVAEFAHAHFVEVPDIAQPEWLAEDGYHPSADGAEQWAAFLAREIAGSGALQGG